MIDSLQASSMVWCAIVEKLNFCGFCAVEPAELGLPKKLARNTTLF